MLYKNAHWTKLILESGHLNSYFNDSCLLTKTKLKKETFLIEF